MGTNGEKKFRCRQQCWWFQPIGLLKEHVLPQWIFLKPFMILVDFRKPYLTCNILLRVILQLAKETASLLHSAHVELDHDWGLDHGAWTVVRRMYPDAKIPVLQLSIDYTREPQYHFDLAKELYELRKKGVLIIGSGNMVHNLRMVSWANINEPEYGYDWALTMNDRFKQLISEGDYKPLINYESLGAESRLAIPTPEHYLPLLYSLGLKGSKDKIAFFNDKAIAGSLTMTSVLIGNGE